ncbi:VOC family protein [Chloroflexota bacterium]
MPIKFSHLHIKTRDPQKTADWWVENLGAKIAGRVHGTGFVLDMDGIPFNVTTMVEEQTRLQHFGLEHLAIRTDDIDNLVNKLKANGARLLEARKNDKTGRRKNFFMETPEGVQIEISEI